ncbi:MAG TPA: carboxypeptidase regulatory-like domain-containing protein [Bryobacteraceae bacterium]|nr:carboxypeptidase regulatory-like domain-containing protein [Bryobacteraceae bacterium]
MLKVFAVALGVFLLTSSLYGQAPVGGATLNGTVTDPSGAAVAGAKVTAENLATGLTRSTTTTAAGLYNFPDLPVGTYDLTVEQSGFKSVKRTGITLAVGAVATLDIPLELGATQETISVTAEVPVVETTRSQTSTVVTTQAVADLPINGRNFLDFTVLTPGVTRDPTRTGDLSFGGQRGTANSLLVDGSDANNVFFGQSSGRAGTGRNPYSFSQDAVQEFQVNTNGYAAEIGRAGGGVINVITKSGTNDFHGTAFEFFRDKALNANQWENNRRGIPKRAYHFNQFGGNFGGPVVKNKLFFFFDYDGQRNTTPNPVFFQVPVPSDPLSQQAAQSLQKYLTPYSNALNNDVYLGKVDWNLTNNQRLSVRYNANRFVGQNFENTGPSSAAEHTGNSNVTTDNVAASHTITIGALSVLESRFVFTRDNEPGFANSAAPEAIIRQNGTTELSIGRNDFSPRYTNAKTYQWAEAFSRELGRHSLKFGLDMDFQQIGNFFPGNFSGSYVFNSLADFAADKPFSYTQAFAGAGTAGALSQPNVNEYSFYAQDSWRATERLTLNYGVRYDFFDYAQPSVHNPDPGLAAMGLDTAKIHLDKNNIGPRAGFAYRLDDRGKTVIRGGYGIYYGRTPSILTGTAITQNGIQVQTYTLFNNFPTYPNILTAPPVLSRTPDIYVFASNYVQPLTHQWSFNVERQIGRDYGLTVGYLGVRGEHLTRTRDVNLYPEVPVQGTIAGVGPVTFYRHPGRIDPNFGRISVFDSGADSIYHGGFIQLTKRFSQGFQVQTSYTFSKAIDDAPDFTSVVVGTDDAKNAQNTLQPNLERGLANADVRHRFVFSGVWDINYAHSLQNPVLRAILEGYQLSSISTVQSGRPFSILVGGDVNNDGNTRTDRPPYVGRNTLIGPNFLDVDIRVTRDFPLYAERVKLRMMFEAFNLTNRANFNSLLTTQYNFTAATNTFSPVAGLGTPTTTFDPRILQLAAKITF